ncbi:MAG: hypothetical protein Q8R87_06715 [Anaerolineaceae bacterium]|nr:hypothetical protein [Anaerolineaceae bacterium]
MDNTSSQIDFKSLLAGFNASTTPLDCGKLCAPFNMSGKPFCCDICHAVPVAYKPEWDYLKTHTTLWHLWRGDECSDEPMNPDDLLEDTPEHLLLLSCKGPDHCEREYRATSCRQFPFFPYISSDSIFIGLAHDWEFESKCWILSHLEQVTSDYRQEFIKTFDLIFSYWMDDFDNYAALSEEVREHYLAIHKHIPLLHRNGSDYLISPKNETLKKINLSDLKKHPPYA